MKTITKTIALALAIFSGTATQAQNISLGLTTGYQLSSYEAFNFDDSYNGRKIGLTGIYSSSENSGISADLTISRTGGSYNKINNRNEVLKYRTETDNIRLTPMYHYFFRSMEDNLRPTVFAGPSLGINIGTKQLSSYNNFSDDFRTLNLAGLVGAGLHYQIINGLWLQGSVNYLVGVTKLNKESAFIPDNLRSNNMSLNLGVTYSLNKAKNKLQ